MNGELEFSTNRAGAAQIAKHLRACDAAFVPTLSGRVDIDDYARKLAGKAVRFEAWDGEQLAGLVAAYCNDKEGRYVFISSVSVLSEWQRKGIASRLLEDCLAYAKDFGAERVELEVDMGNASAIGLYERLGFGKAGTWSSKRETDNSGKHALLMCKKGGRLE